MKCNYCDSPPEGFEGHPGLGPMLQDRAQEGMAFICTVCGSEWIRRHAGKGEFSWLPQPRLARGRTRR